MQTDTSTISYSSNSSRSRRKHSNRLLKAFAQPEIAAFFDSNSFTVLINCSLSKFAVGVLSLLLLTFNALFRMNGLDLNSVSSPLREHFASAVVPCWQELYRKSSDGQEIGIFAQRLHMENPYQSPSEDFPQKILRWADRDFCTPYRKVCKIQRVRQPASWSANLAEWQLEPTSFLTVAWTVLSLLRQCFLIVAWTVDEVEFLRI